MKLRRSLAVLAIVILMGGWGTATSAVAGAAPSRAATANPLAVQIVGPTEMTVGRGCMFHAYATGGNGNYIFNWYGFSARYDYGSSTLGWIDYTGYQWVEVEVFDGENEPAIAGMWVRVKTAAPAC